MTDWNRYFTDPPTAEAPETHYYTWLVLKRKVSSVPEAERVGYVKYLDWYEKGYPGSTAECRS